MNYKKIALYSFFLSALFTQPAHAYAGPGVALGAVIVFLTVVFAFLASTFLSLINFIKGLFKQNNDRGVDSKEVSSTESSEGTNSKEINKS